MRPIKPLAALSDWQQGEFVPVGRSYGGYQGWLHTELPAEQAVAKFYADRACGVTAATNAFVYLKSHPLDRERYGGKLCDGRKQFSEEMKAIYHYIRPQIWGIPLLRSLATGFCRFARSQGMTLTPRYYKLGWRKRKITEIVEFIAEALHKNTPVLLLTWNVTDSELKDFRNHWMTITAIYEQGGEYYIVTSNWGMQKIYSLSRWVNMHSLYRGLLYFEPFDGGIASKNLPRK